MTKETKEKIVVAGVTAVIMFMLGLGIAQDPAETAKIASDRTLTAFVSNQIAQLGDEQIVNLCNQLPDNALMAIVEGRGWDLP